MKRLKMTALDESIQVYILIIKLCLLCCRAGLEHNQ